MTFAQRAFAAADILALPAALIVRFFLVGALAEGFAPLTFAHRALAAALILARPAALILRFLGTLADTEAGAPRIEASSLFNASIFSLRSAARRNCVVVNDDKSLIVGMSIGMKAESSTSIDETQIVCSNANLATVP